MKPTIEHPHIFISYAWGNNDYQLKVLEFAKSLTDIGIDVEFDRWSLKEGNDTYSFMEQMVNNPEITNVLILLDKNYCEKANNHKGGVGTETQIISPEIYEKVKQEKFIPIIFERGENNQIFKPAFLKGILHFDLSDEEKYYSEFQRLVKRLYGINIIEKPEIGRAPDWLTEVNVEFSFKAELSHIVAISNEKEKRHQINIYLKKTLEKLLEEANKLVVSEVNYIDEYKSIQAYRDRITSLTQTFLWFEDAPKELALFLESAKNTIAKNSINNALKDTLIHEIFVTIVGIYFKSGNYESLSYLLNKTFFSSVRMESAKSFDLFYENNQMLNSIVSKRDNKNYYSGTAQLWMETINMNVLTRSDFVAADNLLYNVAVFGNNYLSHWWWFPITYVYDNNDKTIMDFCKKLVSKEYLNKATTIFGYNNSNDFINAIKDREKDEAFSKKSRYRYPAAWNEAPLITDFVEVDKIGKYN